MSLASRLLVSAVLSLAVSPTVGAESDATLFRLFLTDGTSVVSYGEFARVPGSVIFSTPVGGPAESPRLQVVTLPATRVDWTRTDRYTASARYQRYAATRGEEDFARLTNDVARTLNEIALNTDRTKALELAEQARAALAEWPKSHFYYRQRDVNEIIQLLDEAIADLRAASGLNRFDLALVATPGDLELEPMLPMPSPREQLGQLLRIAEMTRDSSEKIALLQAALTLINEAASAIEPADAEAFRRFAENRIRAEQFIDGRYADLTRRMMSSATDAAKSASVRDVERILNAIPKEDDRLGRRRPDTVAALTASVRTRLEDARELRLLRDRWTLRRGLYQDYQRSVGGQLVQLTKSEPALQAVRTLQGPEPAQLLSLRAALSGGAERLGRQQVPSDMRPVHDLLVSAWRFAENAFDTRYRAVQTGSVTTAWEASSAAAGALLMMSRAQEELSELLEQPQLQ